MSNQPAFPFPSSPGFPVASSGMTLRDYFAAVALRGILAAYTGETALPAKDIAARNAYGYADAMLEERET